MDKTEFKTPEVQSNADKTVFAESEFTDDLKAQWQADAFDHPVIEASMKAGCIGEFSFTVKDAGVCPICAEDGFNDGSDTCVGTSRC